ncbi:class I SAM-dependent methyltransferase [Planctomycetota bacterium]
MSIGQSDAFTSSDASQESQYALPYHYICSLEDGHFRQHLYWSWGFRYLGALDLVLSILAEEPFGSLADIGCGDGRFLREVDRRFPKKTLLGIDYSARAINLARAMNPGITYECVDICGEKTVKQLSDVVTLIEVLEHIPPDEVGNFVSAIGGYQKSGDRLVLTVPHENVPLQTKHYQHFNSNTLMKVLEPHYRVEQMLFLDKRSLVFACIAGHLIGNRLFVLNNTFLLDLFYRAYRKWFFLCREAKCGRICVKARRK